MDEIKTWEDLGQLLLNWLKTTGVKIVIAVVLTFIAFKLINFITKLILKGVKKQSQKKGRAYNKTLAHALAYGGKVVLKLFVIIADIAFLGIDVSAITAAIAASGLGIGLALNGALSNLAGGILLLATQPFQEDDFISAAGVDGTVEHIRLCHTVLRTPDNKIVYIPNSNLSSGTVVNYSVQATRRVEWNFNIEYKEDFTRVKELILKIFAEHDLVLKDPAPMVRISEHADSSIKLVARCWVNKDDFWTVKFDITEAVKTAFDQNGINIPFPQLDVHMRND